MAWTYRITGPDGKQIICKSDKRQWNCLSHFRDYFGRHRITIVEELNSSGDWVRSELLPTCQDEADVLCAGSCMDAEASNGYETDKDLALITLGCIAASLKERGQINAPNIAKEVFNGLSGYGDFGDRKEAALAYLGGMASTMSLVSTDPELCRFANQMIALIKEGHCGLA